MPPQVAARVASPSATMVSQTKGRIDSSTTKEKTDKKTAAAAADEKLGCHGGRVKHKRRFCRIDGCERIVKSQGLCQRHGAKPRLCKVDKCTKQAQGNFDGMCKSHFKEHKRKTTPIPAVQNNPTTPPEPTGSSVYDGVLPSSVDFFPNLRVPQHTRGKMPLVDHLAEGFHGGKPPAWHRNEERKARGLLPVDNPATQLEGWERELVWMEILVLTGVPEVSFRHLARAWGRDKGFHMVLAQFICERHGDVQRKKRKRDEDASTVSHDHSIAAIHKRANVAVVKTPPVTIVTATAQSSVVKAAASLEELKAAKVAMLSPERKRQIATILRRRSSGTTTGSQQQQKLTDESIDDDQLLSVGANLWDDNWYGDANYNDALAADLFNLTPQESALLKTRLSSSGKQRPDDDSSMHSAISGLSRSVASGKNLVPGGGKDVLQQVHVLKKRDSSTSLVSNISSTQIPNTVAVEKKPPIERNGSDTFDLSLDGGRQTGISPIPPQQQQYNGQGRNDGSQKQHTPTNHLQHQSTSPPKTQQKGTSQQQQAQHYHPGSETTGGLAPPPAQPVAAPTQQMQPQQSFGSQASNPQHLRDSSQEQYIANHQQTAPQVQQQFQTAQQQYANQTAQPVPRQVQQQYAQQIPQPAAQTQQQTQVQQYQAPGSHHVEHLPQPASHVQQQNQLHHPGHHFAAVPVPTPQGQQVYASPAPAPDPHGQQLYASPVPALDPQGQQLYASPVPAPAPQVPVPAPAPQGQQLYASPVPAPAPQVPAPAPQIQQLYASPAPAPQLFVAQAAAPHSLQPVENSVHATQAPQAHQQQQHQYIQPAAQGQHQYVSQSQPTTHQVHQVSGQASHGAPGVNQGRLYSQNHQQLQPGQQAQNAQGYWRPGQTTHGQSGQVDQHADHSRHQRQHSQQGIPLHGNPQSNGYYQYPTVPQHAHPISNSQPGAASQQYQTPHAQAQQPHGQGLQTATMVANTHLATAGTASVPQNNQQHQQNGALEARPNQPFMHTHYGQPVNNQASGASNQNQAASTQGSTVTPGLGPTQRTSTGTKEQLHDYDHRNEHMQPAEENHAMDEDPSHDQHDYGIEVVHEDHDHDHQHSKEEVVGFHQAAASDTMNNSQPSYHHASVPHAAADLVQNEAGSTGIFHTQQHPDPVGGGQVEQAYQAWATNGANAVPGEGQATVQHAQTAHPPPQMQQQFASHPGYSQVRQDGSGMQMQAAPEYQTQLHQTKHDIATYATNNAGVEQAGPLQAPGHVSQQTQPGSHSPQQQYPSQYQQDFQQPQQQHYSAPSQNQQLQTTYQTQGQNEIEGNSSQPLSRQTSASHHSEYQQGSLSRQTSAGHHSEYQQPQGSISRQTSASHHSEYQQQGQTCPPLFEAQGDQDVSQQNHTHIQNQTGHVTQQQQQPYCSAQDMLSAFDNEHQHPGQNAAPTNFENQQQGQVSAPDPLQEYEQEALFELPYTTAATASLQQAGDPGQGGPQACQEGVRQPETTTGQYNDQHSGEQVNLFSGSGDGQAVSNSDPTNLSPDYGQHQLTQQDQTQQQHDQQQAQAVLHQQQHQVEYNQQHHPYEQQDQTRYEQHEQTLNHRGQAKLEGQTQHAEQPRTLDETQQDQHPQDQYEVAQDQNYAAPNQQTQDVPTGTEQQYYSEYGDNTRLENGEGESNYI
ncbi:expressed unknown protein [Seminavis robusta]|uniref:Uncharacterized protein n=1 Tax=Seminavis robusta TaxID=568900 RepID=A0A9N8D966_9STRA|nr:expressed unknown protein [Seminavis robusta]|eukprot:Sro44_g026470.1 n/a (1657) ;mRNA; r:14517-19718